MTYGYVDSDNPIVYTATSQTPSMYIEYRTYASILADLARELLCLYADDHETIMREFCYSQDESRQFDSEIDRIGKRIDHLEKQLLQLGDTYKINRTKLP